MSSGLGIESFSGYRIAYRIGTSDEAVIADSFENDILFAAVPEYKPHVNDVIIDIGAHIGTFTLLASSKVPSGTVYAIEACADSCNLVHINKALNCAANISVHHLAITDKRGTCTLFYDTGNWGHSVVAPLSSQVEIVRTCTLSDFFRDNDINLCNFMKLNCEGAEFPILLCTPAVDLRKVHMMLILYHCDLWKHNTEQDLIAHLQGCGFNTLLRNKVGQRGWIIATIVK